MSVNNTVSVTNIMSFINTMSVINITSVTITKSVSNMSVTNTMRVTNIMSVIITINVTNIMSFPTIAMVGKLIMFVTFIVIITRCIVKDLRHPTAAELHFSFNKRASCMSRGVLQLQKSRHLYNTVTALPHTSPFS